MKFLYISDLHLDEMTPPSRLDDFHETVKTKIKEILSIAKQHEVKAILQGGDFFHKPKVSNEFVTDFMQFWNEELFDTDIQELTLAYQSGQIDKDQYIQEILRYMNAAIPIVSIIGNHDIIGEQLDSYPKTSLHMLESNGFLHITSKEEPVLFQEDGLTVAVSGSSYRREWDRTDDKSGYIVEDKALFNGVPVDFQIHLTHGMLMDKSYGKKFPHTTVFEIADKTQADVTLNGHDHIGYETIAVDGKQFANPGSPFRMKAEKKEIARTPKVLLVEVTKEHGCVLTDFYLQSAQKGEDILTDEPALLAKKKQHAMAKIQTMINQSSVQKGLRIADIIDNIGNAKHIDPEVLKEIQERIVNSMHLLQPVYHPVGEYYITRLELENFLSHKESAFDLEPGLNILSGESRCGKSAVLRALRELMTCSLPQPRDAIFFGASYFKITAYTSTGYVVSRIVEKDDKKGFNGYEIFDPTTGQVSRYNTKSVSLVQEILGYTKIPLTDKKNIDINSVIQGDSWFYLGTNMTAPDRARLIGVVYGTHYADAAMKELGSLIKKTTANASMNKKELERLEAQKKQYDYIAPLEDVIKQAELKMEELEKMQESLEKIKALQQLLTSIESELNELQIADKKLEQLKTIPVAELRKKRETLDLATHYANQLQVITTEGIHHRQVYNMLLVLPECKDRFMKAKQTFIQLEKEKEEAEKAVKLYNSLQTQGLELQQLKQVQDSLPDMEVVKEKARQLRLKQQALSQLKEVTDKAMQLASKQEALTKELTHYQAIESRLMTLPKREQLQALQEKQVTIQKAKQLNDTLQTLSSETDLQLKALEENKCKTLQHVEEYKKQLLELGECPICHSAINTSVVTELVSEHYNKMNE